MKEVAVDGGVEKANIRGWARLHAIRREPASSQRVVVLLERCRRNGGEEEGAERSEGGVAVGERSVEKRRKGRWRGAKIESGLG